MNREWLERTGLAWLTALEDETGFAESVWRGVAATDQPRTFVTQARLGYCWAHLAQLFPHKSEFARAATKSFGIVQQAAFTPNEAHFSVYDQSFFLLFLAWHFRLTGDPAVLSLMKGRFAVIERHLDNAGAGGFAPQPAGIRSHNPYMHLLEALLAAFRLTEDEYWLGEARRIEALFFERLLNHDRQVVFEFLNTDWSVKPPGRIEIGHQLEWSTLLRELHRFTGGPRLLSTAQTLHEFAMRHGFEDGLAIDAVKANGSPLERRKLLWSQLEVAKHLSGQPAAAHWSRIRQRFFQSNGWTWYNARTPEGQPVEEPSNARLLYHVVTAAAAE